VTERLRAGRLYRLYLTAVDRSGRVDRTPTVVRLRVI
jgi:hypothetical protein